MIKPNMAQKDIIRKGDKIRIIKPYFFIRCGYPKSNDTETNTVIEKYEKQIKEMVYDQTTPSSVFNTQHIDRHLLTKIAKEIAYARLRINGFGGAERTIHTKHLEELKDKEYTVGEIKYHKTGTYSPPSHSGDYYEEYEPATLENAKTHKILSLTPIGVHIFDRYDLRIEAANVEKIHPNNSFGKLRQEDGANGDGDVGRRVEEGSISNRSG